MSTQNPECDRISKQVFVDGIVKIQRREGPMKMGVDIGMMSRNTWGYQQPPEVRKKLGGILTYSLQRKNGPAHKGISDLLPPGL